MSSSNPPNKPSAPNKSDQNGNTDPLIMIDNIENQLKEMSLNLDKEEIFYNNFQNSFSIGDEVSIEPIQNK